MLPTRRSLSRFVRIPSIGDVCLLSWAIIQVVRTDDVANHVGHLKPFGSVGPYLETDEIGGFPTTASFFNDHANQLKPLKMVGAAKLSTSFHRWSDEYLQSHHSSPDYTVSVETGKKENRSNAVLNMSFQAFVSEYNSTDRYMVDSVPEFLREDVLLPGPLQCAQIYEEMLVENILWMSSGGTSSVVHTDSVDNIICSYRGEKQFILIDPSLHQRDVDLDHPEGAYSGIDVDHVDYFKYPGLASVSYHVINLSAGDCLYIPFKWIHQVRSFGSNIAVNIWWSHQKIRHLDLNRCTDKLDPNLTLDKVTFVGFAPATDDVDMLKDHFADFVKKEMDLSQFVAIFVPEQQDADESYILPLKQVFLIMDKDRNRRISPDEIAQLSNKEWKAIQGQMHRFEDMMEDAAISEEFEDQHSRYDEL